MAFDRKAYMSAWAKENRPALNEYYRVRRNLFSDQYRLHGINYRARLKRDVVERMGGCCSCCGENDIDVLSVDHAGNDGAADRLLPKHAKNNHVYREARDMMDFGLDVSIKYSVMCFTCNWIKNISGKCGTDEHGHDVIIPTRGEAVKEWKRTSGSYENDRTLAHRWLCGKCKTCGEANWKALCLDHVHNDGASRRRESSIVAPAVVRKMILSNEKVESIFDLLCRNCNFKKHRTASRQ